MFFLEFVKNISKKLFLYGKQKHRPITIYRIETNTRQQTVYARYGLLSIVHQQVIANDLVFMRISFFLRFNAVVLPSKSNAFCSAIVVLSKFYRKQIGKYKTLWNMASISFCFIILLPKFPYSKKGRSCDSTTPVRFDGG